MVRYPKMPGPGGAKLGRCVASRGGEGRADVWMAKVKTAFGDGWEDYWE